MKSIGGGGYESQGFIVWGPRRSVFNSITFHLQVIKVLN